MSQQAIIIWGMGEVGGVLARAVLKSGYPVLPVTRDIDAHALAEDLPDPEMVIIAVGENDLGEVLKSCPASWLSRLVLIQNELLPRNWLGLPQPTVMSVWFEKKKGQDVKVVMPSILFGSYAHILIDALARLDIPANEVDSPEALEFELIAKNMYILTTNLCGLKTGGTVQELRNQHSEYMNRVFDDILQIQQALVGHELDRDALMKRILEAFDGDPDHPCKGRSAPQRLERALKQ
ncbi:MAG: hypothetical protein D6698_08375, partial [Gammaproteobacteria bacterium]